MYDTIVTSSLGREIAESYGLKVESFLTGFKFIGDRIAHYEALGKGPTFVFGYEESYGCLIAPFVRDKDGIQAILLYCEMALWHFLRKEPLDVAYDKLMEKYGYHDAVCNSVYFEGPQGAANMAKIMETSTITPYAKSPGSRSMKSMTMESSFTIKMARPPRSTFRNRKS
jgi:phosphomannomutase